jgi:putative SOS response-associated peptidase YedK
MCNDYEHHIRAAQYGALAQQLDIPFDVPGEPPWADDIRVGDTGPVLVAAGNGGRMVSAKFGLPQPGRAPLFNFKSDGRHFHESPRCIVPASAFFEFTGAKSPKTKHRFELEDAECMGIAGRYWPDERAFAMLTTAPGEDIKRYHDRQIVILRPEQWAAWLFLHAGDEAGLLKPLPAGSLRHEVVRVGKGEEHLYQVG